MSFLLQVPKYLGLVLWNNVTKKDTHGEDSGSGKFEEFPGTDLGCNSLEVNKTLEVGVDIFWNG